MLNRKQFLLLSSSGLLLPTVRAGAQNPPTRTPLPTDNALSVYIGVAATWQSLQTNAVRQREFSAEVSSYLLSETPTLENLQDHEIAFESLPPEPGWAVFAPQNNQFQFKFNITDARGRLGKIVVKALQSGTVLTQITAAADGASLVGVMLGDWNIAYYQIEGYDKTGNALFRLGATQGKFDTYVPFPISSGFVPNRPAFIPCAHYKAPDGLIGVEGDPYSVSGVVSGQSGTSRGCGYHDKVNDNSAPASIEPPDTFFQYIKHKKALDTASTNLGSFKSGDPQATQALVNLLTALTKEDATRALTNVDIPPYSDGCGH